MTQERISIDEIIEVWKSQCAIEKIYPNGSTRWLVPIQNRVGHFSDLAKTLIDHGYTASEISSETVSNKVVACCWADDIKTMSKTAVANSKRFTKQNWKMAALRFSNIKISTYTESNKHVKSYQSVKSSNTFKKEIDLKDYEPKNWIKMDTSDMAEVPFDDQLLAELAAIGTIIDGK